MGCDIHPYIEVYNRDTGIWHTVVSFPYAGASNAEAVVSFNEINNVSWPPFVWELENKTIDRKIRRRNYSVFALLADVRNSYGSDHVPPICDPKGLPEDITAWANLELDHEYGDIHSQSWHDFDELLEAKESLKGNQNADWLESFFETIQTIREQFSSIHSSDIRLVFGFDN